MVRIAARISHGCRASVVWNERAVPWNEPYTVAGTPIRALISLIAAAASESGTPTGRLNEMVDEANWPWWFTESGALE